MNTHRELTEQAINIMEAELNSYLINNLGLEGGLNANVKGGSPRELMIQGSNDEDNPPRFLRHFHEPIANGGLLNGTFDSSINWSLKSAGAQDGEDSFSWNDAREYYFKALTSETKAERDEYWGKTFRALGHVMHLLQDSANPSHVRDDPHPFDDGLHDYMERKSVGSYIGGGIFNPDPSMLEQSGATRSEPFSNLFDRNVYSGSNPLATLGADIGVTEYTNANFFTDDTIPGQGSIFNAEIAYPAVTELVPAPIPSPYLTLPRLGSATFPRSRAAKLTGNQAVAQFLLTNTNLDLLGQLELDDAVYDAQAQNLIPRAVGYSAAVLKYFFRGDMPILRQEYLVSESDEGDEKPFREVGTLDVSIEVPFSLGFQGEMLFYVELSNGNRLEFDRLTWNGTNPVRAFNFPQVDDFVLFEPVRWYVVLKGAMGPGSQEPEAIVGKAGLAIWIVSPLPR
ncbi:MAG: hypothetical protein MRJ67_11030 [Nitrospirales bacterium]|nr:hypothetical protein [Nitrospirales bacterium]